MELQQGDVAVVTGAASGIGLALANRFARSGMHVVMADVQADALEHAAAEVRAAGVEVLTTITDVSKADQVEALAAATYERFGAAHVVCNNAGVAGAGDPWFGPISTWEWVFGVNFWGVAHGVRAFLPRLAMQGRGYFVNTASIAGLLPGFGPTYGASKFAVVALTTDLYTMLSSAGLPIGVSVLCPGWVRTNIMDSDRNWPDELGEKPVRAAASEVALKHSSRAIDEGMPPAAVADLVWDAVAADRFWVFPNPEWLELCQEHWHNIAERRNPAPFDLPGMPPAAQIMAEVMAALAPPS